MQIVCPTCATGYDVEPSSLGTAGRSVRCVRCRTVWFATPPLANAVVAPASPAEAAEWTSWSDEEPPAGSQSDAAAPSIVDGEVSLSAVATTMDAPPLAPMDADIGSLPAAAPFAGPRQDIETVAARRARPQSPSRRFALPRLRLSGAMLALVVAHAALIIWRVDVVRLMPQTGSLYALIRLPVNLRGLAIEDVKTARETHDGVPVLVVEGTLANVARAALEVPRLRFAVRNDRGAEVYAWTAPPARAILNPGEQVAFRSRLASPPGEGREVIVRFFNRRDSAAGLR